MNWNTRELLRGCLESLRSASRESRLVAETIVVDNASGDGSALMVAEDFADVVLIANADNRNYAAGTNQALAVATGELVLLLNPDTEVPPGALDALATELSREPGAAAISPALVHPTGELQVSVRGFPSPWALFGDVTGLARFFPSRELGAYRARRYPTDSLSAVDQPMASAFLVRGELLRRLGGLDERFPLFFNDVDLCWRIRETGATILYDPRIRVLHHGGASTRQVRAEAIELSHAGLLLFYELHYRRRLSPLLYAAIRGMIRLAGRVRVRRALSDQRGSVS